MWAVQVRLALEEVAACRAVASVPGLKPNDAADLLERADELEIGGPGSASKLLNEEAARKLYKERTGIDVTNPEDMARVYASLDKMHKQRLQQQAEAEKASRAAKAKSRGKAVKSSKIGPPLKQKRR